MNENSVIHIFYHREQYTHILQTIKETGVVDTAREGFNKVKDHLQGAVYIY